MTIRAEVLKKDLYTMTSFRTLMQRHSPSIEVKDPGSLLSKKIAGSPDRKWLQRFWGMESAAKPSVATE